VLAAYAAGAKFEPLGVPIGGPAPSEIGARLDEVREWVAERERAGRGSLRVGCRKVGGRQIGTNLIPGRAWLDDYGQVWALLGVRGDVRSLGGLADQARTACPRLVPRVQGHPMKALRLADRWQQLVATVRWIDERQTRGMYLRGQVPVPPQARLRAVSGRRASAGRR